MADKAPDQVTIHGDAAVLNQAADTLKGRRVRAGVRAFVIPADGAAFSEAIDSGAIADLQAAGFVICYPGSKAATAQGEVGLTVPDNPLIDTMDAVLNP